MKIKTEHYNYIKEVMVKKDLEVNLEAKQNLIEESGKKAYINKLFWACNLSSWICKNIYPYANDKNINSVLNKIQKEI